MDRIFVRFVDKSMLGHGIVTGNYLGMIPHKGDRVTITHENRKITAQVVEVDRQYEDDYNDGFKPTSVTVEVKDVKIDG